MDLSPFIRSVHAILERHALDEPGAYSRFTIPGVDETGQARSLGQDPYGCADAANLLYTLGELPNESAGRADWVATLQRLQDPQSGLFRESTHHEIHTTAHCLGALELFDALPLHPLEALAPLREIGAIETFLDQLDWAGAAWTQAHQGAGVYAALVLARESTVDFENRYFRWLMAEVDPATGLLRRGAISPSPTGEVFSHLAGTFHYLFNFEHARRAWPHPEALVDLCLAIRSVGVFPLARHVWFADIDWIYCLSRAMRQTKHRFDEAQSVLAAFAVEYAEFVLQLDPAEDQGLDDLHRLFGVVCALAELQRAVPGSLATERPLRLVLDRRPFI